MGKHNAPRRHNRGGQIVVAAAAATVLAGWAAPIASADEGAADNAKPSNPVSKTADAVKGAVDGVRKAVTGAAGSVQRAAQNGLQVGSGGAGSLQRPNSSSPRTSFSGQTNGGGSERAQSNLTAALAPDTTDTPTGSVTIPVVGVTLPGLPDGPRFALPTPSPGIPPGFGSQGTNTVPVLGPLSNGNNLFGGNFFNIGDDNLLTANQIGTGLQGIIVGDDNTLAGNQVIVPGSSGTNFGWMGDDNGSVLDPQANFDLNDLLTLDPAVLFAVAQPSGTNLVGSPFSYGNNTFIMGDGNKGTGNNVILGAGNFGNNMHWIGDNADLSGNNVVAGLGSFGNNMSVIGDNSPGSGNNNVVGLGAFGNNIGLIGSAASNSGNNTNLSAFGFAQNFVLVGDAADNAGNNTHVSPFWGYAQNIALIGAGASGSGNNFGTFNFALVGSGVEDAGNNYGDGFNVAILPGEDQGNCTGAACFSIFGFQFGN
jgi:hypothetical protein